MYEIHLMLHEVEIQNFLADELSEKKDYILKKNRKRRKKNVGVNLHQQSDNSIEYFQEHFL